MDVTKLSYYAYAFCADKFVLLDAGSALGNNCGPVLISKRHITAAGRSRKAGSGSRFRQDTRPRIFS